MTAPTLPDAFLSPETAQLVARLRAVERPDLLREAIVIHCDGAVEGGYLALLLSDSRDPAAIRARRIARRREALTALKALDTSLRARSQAADTTDERQLVDALRHSVRSCDLRLRKELEDLIRSGEDTGELRAALRRLTEEPQADAPRVSARRG